MIYGIGVDCTQVERIAKSVQKQHFLERVYRADERALFDTLGAKHAAESAAANFAAKEAFMKAAGVGLGGFALHDLGVLRLESGAPYFALEGGAADYCAQHRLTPHLSITHDGGLAIAFVVLEQEAAPG